MAGGGGVHARLHEGFVATLLLSNSPRLKTSPELALQFSFYVRLALATLALRETSSAVTPAFRFSSLCRLISSPPQPFWEFLSSVLMRWGLCFRLLLLVLSFRSLLPSRARLLWC